MELTDDTTGETITEEEVNEVLELFGITDTPQLQILTLMNYYYVSIK